MPIHDWCVNSLTLQPGAGQQGNDGQPPNGPGGPNLHPDPGSQENQGRGPHPGSSYGHQPRPPNDSRQRPPNPGAPIPTPPPPPRAAPQQHQAFRAASAPQQTARPAAQPNAFYFPPPPPSHVEYRQHRGRGYYAPPARPASAPPPYPPSKAAPKFFPAPNQRVDKLGAPVPVREHVHQGHARPSMGVECKDCEPPSVVDDHASRWPSVDVPRDNKKNPFLRTKVRKS